MIDKYVLGIWDGHDAGAALIHRGNIVFAVNEERLSRRKLEVGFPVLSIGASLAYAGIEPEAVTEVAFSTSDPAKTLTRLLPSLKEEYYLIRRRKRRSGKLDNLKKAFKYRLTEMGPNRLSRALTRQYASSALNRVGFRNIHLTLWDHHRCHAETAARLSGFASCTVLTLDGVGDGLCGSVWRFGDNRLQNIKNIPAKVSLGIFFEHITNLMNMRELEDEGKVMALANYAFPVPDVENPLLKLFQTEGLDLVSKHRSVGLYRELKRVLWQYPSEQFAFMAQRALEKATLTLVENALKTTGEPNIALAGGVFSNIKLNMKIEQKTQLKKIFVFPHMGDGGLALGAAIGASHQQTDSSRYVLKDLYTGPRFSENQILSSLKQWHFPYEKLDDASETAARLILNGEIILWFQGRMELGPRALGNRSILARPDNREIKDRLNLVLKKRVWYQPFCPSMLLHDAPAILEIEGRHIESNRFMTTGFRVKRECLALMAGVTNIDGTCRPHFVGDENRVYRDLLINIKKTLGRGVILNTSFNIHGEPMVCTPDEAIDMFHRTQINHLFLENFLVRKE